MIRLFKILFYILYFLCMLLVWYIGCSQIEQEESDEDWSFVTFGDVRQGFGVYGKLALFMSGLEPTPKFAICLGDIMGTAGNEVEWVNFWNYSKPVTNVMPMYMVRGNHEGNDPASEKIYKEQTNTVSDTFYFTFSYDRAFFIILDSFIKDNENKIGTDQFAWLSQQLNSAANDTVIQHVFVMIHHPLYPQGKYQDEPMENAEEVHSLFTQHSKIKCVIVSHEHLYNKYEKDGIVYITSGGGGAPLYHGYGGDFHHFIKVSMYNETGRINIKTIGIFNEVLIDFDL